MRTFKPRRIAGNEKPRELGFGNTVTTSGRLMNADGSFNVERQALGAWDNAYHHLITMSWARFFGLMLLAYLLLNLLFALLYLLAGIDNLNGISVGEPLHNFMEAYFFSTQTLTTVGYGRVNPQGLPANLIAAIESFTGLLAFALISGLLYGRFSRPLARIVFSDNMLIAPYRQGRALMIRISNARKSELIESEAQMIVALNQAKEDGSISRTFFPLPLEISKISFFSLSWTLVHALDEKSPLWGFSLDDLSVANSEVLLLVKGTDETNQQEVHARRSYVAADIVENARFRPIIGRNQNGTPTVHSSQVSDYELLQDQ